MGSACLKSQKQVINSQNAASGRCLLSLVVSYSTKASEMIKWDLSGSVCTSLLKSEQCSPAGACHYALSFWGINPSVSCFQTKTVGAIFSEQGDSENLCCLCCFMKQGKAHMEFFCSLCPSPIVWVMVFFTAHVFGVWECCWCMDVFDGWNWCLHTVLLCWLQYKACAQCSRASGQKYRAQHSLSQWTVGSWVAQ